jgi:prepilin signal peptidase PulO-like enzyme (type II secretory pathway)
VILFFIFGLLFGSFINCLLWRLYKGENVLGRSYCPKCRKDIKWYDNIPILSFIFLKGECRSCRKKIHWQYPVVEFVGGLLFLFSYLYVDSLSFFGSHKIILLFKLLFLVSIMLFIFVYDLRWQLVSMIVVIPSCIIMFVFNILLGFSWLSMIISALISGGFFLLQFILTKKKGIGEGDIWLGLLIGVVFPDLQKLFLAIFLAYLIGSVTGLILMILKRKDWGSRLPLGVFLMLSCSVTVFFGNSIISWYLNLF